MLDRHCNSLCYYLCVLLWLVAVRQCSGVDIISSSKLEACTANGTQGANSTSLSCKQKLVITVTVDSGDTTSSQDIALTVSCVGSPTGSCPCPCNYAVDASCTCRDLASILTIKLSKTPLLASYPLTYLQAFNYKPYEAIVRLEDGNCKDGAYETSPTCGWYYKAGQQVPDSQGFVCTCDTSQIWDDTFGTSKQKTRANLNCDFFAHLGIIIGRTPCSSHCLMMDDHWYGGYSLGEAMLQFEISAALQYSGTTSSSSSEMLTLSPSVPMAVSSSKALLAKLLGDLASYSQLPVLSEKVLMIPHPKKGQTLQDVFANKTEWMLLDRSLISFTGTECDKVGTSFTAFRYQAAGCKRAPQVCLFNQLRDILQADQARIAAGRVPLYLVSQYTYGLESQLKAFTGGPLSFVLPVTGIRSSLVLLEAQADSISFITNVSPGRIIAARMCQFAETSCGGFEASASRGYLHALVVNTGTLVASYTLTVSNCSVNIRAVEAQRFSLVAGQNGTISPFQIFVEDDTSVANRHCWLTLLNSQGGVSDSMLVTFYTNATIYDDWASGGLIGNGTGAGTLTKAQECANKCSNPLNILCAAKNKCWGRVGKFLGLLGGSLLGIAALVFAAKTGLLITALQAVGPILEALCWPFGSSSSSGGKGSSRKQYNSKSGGKHGKKQQREIDLFSELCDGPPLSNGKAHSHKKTSYKAGYDDDNYAQGYEQHSTDGYINSKKGRADKHDNRSKKGQPSHMRDNSLPDDDAGDEAYTGPVMPTYQSNKQSRTPRASNMSHVWPTTQYQQPQHQLDHHKQEHRQQQQRQHRQRPDRHIEGNHQPSGPDEAYTSYNEGDSTKVGNSWGQHDGESVDNSDEGVSNNNNNAVWGSSPGVEGSNASPSSPSNSAAGNRRRQQVPHEQHMQQQQLHPQQQRPASPPKISRVSAVFSSIASASAPGNILAANRRQASPPKRSNGMYRADSTEDDKADIRLAAARTDNEVHSTAATAVAAVAATGAAGGRKYLRGDSSSRHTHDGRMPSAEIDKLQHRYQLQLPQLSQPSPDRASRDSQQSVSGHTTDSMQRQQSPSRSSQASQQSSMPRHTSGSMQQQRQQLQQQQAGTGRDNRTSQHSRVSSKQDMGRHNSLKPDGNHDYQATSSTRKTIMYDDFFAPYTDRASISSSRGRDGAENGQSSDGEGPHTAGSSKSRRGSAAVAAAAPQQQVPLPVRGHSTIQEPASRVRQLQRQLQQQQLTAAGSPVMLHPQREAQFVPVSTSARPLLAPVRSVSPTRGTTGQQRQQSVPGHAMLHDGSPQKQWSKHQTQQFGVDNRPSSAPGNWPYQEQQQFVPLVLPAGRSIEDQEAAGYVFNARGSRSSSRQHMADTERGRSSKRRFSHQRSHSMASNPLYMDDD